MSLTLTTPTGARVRRIDFVEREATEDQAAGPDGGRVSPVAEYQFTAPGYDVDLVAIGGDDTRAVLEASLDGNTGPWTDLSTGPLAVLVADYPEGETVSVWVRLRTLRWSPDTDSPLLSWRFGLGRVGAANITG